MVEHHLGRLANPETYRIAAPNRLFRLDVVGMAHALN
jgi:hypothetical protein